MSAEHLATRLGITTRTVRRDIARLRELGYPVNTELGPAGGYRLPPGASLPPLLFETDEALTVLLSLLNEDRDRTAASAIDKLQRVLPSQVRSAATALLTHSTDLHLGHVVGVAPPRVDIATLGVLAVACRDRRLVSCRLGNESCLTTPPTSIEPLRLVRTMGRWYLVAYDVSEGRWGPIPVDEMSDVRLLTAGATQRPPSEAPSDLVTRHVLDSVRKVTATVRAHAPEGQVARWVEPAWGRVVRESARSTLIECGADTYDRMARWLLLIGCEITVLEPPELRDAFARTAALADRAAWEQGQTITRER